MKLSQHVVFCFILLFVGSAISAQQPKFEIIKSVIVGERVSLTSAWADFNNDGWIDLYANGTLYRNDKAIFKSVTPETIQKNVGGYGKIWADFDGDGAMDLTIMNTIVFILLIWSDKKNEFTH